MEGAFGKLSEEVSQVHVFLGQRRLVLTIFGFVVDSGSDFSEDREGNNASLINRKIAIPSEGADLIPGKAGFGSGGVDYLQLG